MRSWLGPPLLALVGCAGPLPEPVPLDFDAHCRLTVEGFVEANPHVAERLDGAAAWAVFPEVADAAGDCEHEGRLFRPNGTSSRSFLRCGAGPTAPAGVTYHVLVILGDPSDVERLAEADLDLTGAPHLEPHDVQGRTDDSAARLVVTSERGGLLFDPGPLRQSLALVGPGAGPISR